MNRGERSVWDKFLEWGWRQEANRQNKVTELERNKVIDMMADDTDPSEVTIENAYKTRWIWYHTILAIGIFFTNILLTAILVILAVKL
ncbi:MAG: hypothetical protein ACKVJK_00940 [Methylophagaceae bacterium]|jgi:hypothetical protein|tara:strand:- start:269 stop:532 length:264 start_codon:yes stop_codon:yes gene_type:complete